MCAELGASVISTSEELAFPEAQHAGLAAELRAIAQQNHVAILATGVNPGFVFDVLPLTLAEAAWDVRRITIRRVLDASVFGRDVQRHLGLGYAEDDFHQAVRAGKIWGHIGFPESAAMLCRKMGRTLNRVEQVLDPVMASRDYQLRDWRVAAGNSVGVSHRAVAWVGEEPWLEFEVALHVAPADVGWTVKDEITISGRHSLTLTLEPGCHAVLTTAARLVNSIPQVLQAPPGLYAPVDLPPSGPWLAPALAVP
jgi:4-hydroxy-tetrahydrodipicolinate reductase